MLKIRIATEKDDALLREVLRTEALPGKIQLFYLREPHFFKSFTNQASTTEIIVGEDDKGVAGICGSSTWDVYVNGQKDRIGYIHSLRIHPRHRNSLTFGRGIRFFNSLHKDGDMKVYLATVITGRRSAEGIITSGRHFLPKAFFLGKCHTYAVPLSRRRGLDPMPGLEIRKAGKADALDVRKFYQAHAHGRQLAFQEPAYLEDEEIYLAFKKNCLVGILSAYHDPSHQIRIAGYPAFLKIFVRAGNWTRRLRGMRNYPLIGDFVVSYYVRFALVSDSDPQVFRALFLHTYNDLIERGDFLTVSLFENDPLRAGLRGIFRISYPTNLYFFHWENGSEWVQRYDATKIPVIDPGVL